MRTDRKQGQAPAPVHVLISIVLVSILFLLPAAVMAGHSFRANAGIWPEDILYLANRGTHAVYFKRGEVIIEVKAPSLREDGQGAQGSAVRLRFAGANPNPRIEATEPTPALHSYYIGSAASGWRRSVREYGGIIYRDLWPGVDLLFRDLGGEIGYAILGDPASLPQVRWTYEGAQQITQSGSERTIVTASGNLLERANLSGTMGWFSTGQASPSLAQAPNREVPWSSFLGGGLAVGKVHVASGPDGSLIVAGNAASSYAPADIGDRGQELQVGAKIFVARFSASRQLEWVCFLGGAATDLVHTMKVGRYNIIIGGESSSSDFPRTLPTLGTATGTGSRAFLARLSVTDGDLVWSRLLGLGNVQSVAVQSDGVHFAAGRTNDPAFPTTTGAHDRTPGPGIGGDGFVTSLDLQGNLRWSSLLGGSGAELIAAVSLDAQSRPVVAGRTNSIDFPTTTSAHDRTLGGATDNFVTCFTADGSGLAWSTYLGGSADELVSSLAVGAQGEIVVGGGTESADFPIVGAQARAHSSISAGAAARDGFVTALAPDGRSILWSSCLGGSQADEVFALEVDAQGRILATGSTASGDFWLGASASVRSYAGAGDAFLVRFASSGGGQTDGILLGGGRAESGATLACLSNGTTVVGGLTSSPDFPTTYGAYDPCFQGRVAIFVSEVDLPSEGMLMADLALEGDGAPPAPLSNSPNPFNPVTTVSWELRQGAVVDIDIYDVAGRLVRSLLSEARMPAGRHSLVWGGDDVQGRSLPSGIYLCRLRADEHEQITRMTLLK